MGPGWNLVSDLGNDSTNNFGSLLLASNYTASKIRVGKHRVEFDLTLNSGVIDNGASNIADRPLVFVTRDLDDDPTTSNHSQVYEVVEGFNSIDVEVFDDGVEIPNLNFAPSIFFSARPSSVFDVDVSNLEVSHVTEPIVRNGNDAVQATAGSQPKIVDAGVLVRDSKNNPAIDFDGIDDNMDLTSSLATVGAYSCIAYHEFIYPTMILKGDLNVPRIRGTSGTNYQIGSYTPQVTQDFTVASTLGLVSVLKDASHNARVYANGTESSSGQQNVGSGSRTFTTLGTSTNDGAGNGKIVELIYYPSDQSANRAAIETNINNQYDIY